MHRHSTPVLINLEPVPVAEPLPRHDLRDRREGGYDERWIQELVHLHPDLAAIVRDLGSHITLSCR
jgi:hypothetical protein